MAAFSTFLDNADSLAALKDSITGVNDEFNAMADTMTDNVAGAMAGLRSAAEELVLKISEGTEGPVKDLINGLTSMVRGIGSVIEWMQKYGTVIKAVAVALGTYKVTTVVLTALHKAYTATVSLASISFHRFKVATEAAARSQQGLKIAMASTPWGAVLAAVGALIAVFYTLKQATDSLAASKKAMKEVEDKVTDGMTAQKASIEALVAAAKNENLAMDQRAAAVKKLNSIIPGYNAQIDAATGKYKASNEALKQYLKNLEKKIRYEANQEEYAKLMKEEERLRKEKENADAAAETERQNNANLSSLQPRPLTSSGGGGAAGYSLGYNQSKYIAKEYAEGIAKQYEAAKASRIDMEEYIKRGLSSGEMSTGLGEDVAETVEENVTKPIKAAGAAATDTIDKIKELKSRLKELRKREPETDEEYEEIEAEKKKIQAQLKQLKGDKAKTKKGKREKGTYGEDSIDEVTAPIDDAHQKRALDINKQKGEISDTELAIKKNKELIQYCQDLNVALDKMKEGVDATHTQTLDKINKEQNANEQKMQKAEQDLKKALDQQGQQAHKDRLKAFQVFHDNMDAEMQSHVAKEEMTRQEADLYMMNQAKKLHEDQLKELQAYYKEVEKSENLGAEEKRKRLDDIQDQIRQKNSEILTDTGKWVEKMRELSKSADPVPLADLDKKKKELKAVYDMAIKLQEALGQDTTALKKARNSAIAAVDREKSDLLYQTRSQLGLTTWQEQFKEEMKGLDDLKKQGLVKEEDYQKAVFNLKMKYAQRYFDYYTQMAGSMFTALQDAEIATSEAKYDVLIQQAKNNGGDTAALEEEKENKKLEIQKKYADVNFAIKISQIIADTAVSIMKAFSELGPIGGAVAAAMLTATGAAQVISAKAERDKIKNMSPSSTASGASTPAQAQRVLNGFSEGGYTGDGGRYEVAGLVHKGEYVIPKPIMGDPRVIDAVGMIEALRCKRIPATSGDNLRKGFADGGFTSDSTAPDYAEFREAVEEFRDAARSLRAYVVLRDIDKARQEDERARKPFRKNK